MSEPRQVTAGDTWNWSRSESAYPASAGWVLTYYLAIADETPKTIACTPSVSGPDHVAELGADASASWAPGRYLWMARVAKGAERYTVGSGALDVLPDHTSAGDRRTTAAKCLAAITAVLERRMGDSIVEYEIDGVKAKHLPHNELLKLQGVYRRAVRRENGESTSRAIPVRFSRV